MAKKAKKPTLRSLKDRISLLKADIRMLRVEGDRLRNSVAPAEQLGRDLKFGNDELEKQLWDVTKAKHEANARLAGLIKEVEGAIKGRRTAKTAKTAVEAVLTRFSRASFRSSPARSFPTRE